MTSPPPAWVFRKLDKKARRAGYREDRWLPPETEFDVHFARELIGLFPVEGFRQERWSADGTFALVSTAIQKFAELNEPLSMVDARRLLLLLDRLVDMGDRRAAALQQSEHFRSIQLAA
jgi:hypothetical protein